MAKKTTKKKTTKKPANPDMGESNMRAVSLDINALKKSDANPRTHTDKNAKAVDQSLENHGQVEPILVQKKTGAIIHGHLRWQRMKKAGYQRCDCVLLDVDDNTAYRMAVDLNRTGELAGWDESVLGEILSKAQTDGYSPAGFSEDEVNKMIDSSAVQEYAESGGDPSFDLNVFDDEQLNKAREKQEEKQKEEDSGSDDGDDEQENKSDTYAVIVETENESSRDELAKRLANEGYSVRKG